MKAYKHILFLLFFGLLTLQQVHADNVGKFTLQKVANLSDDASALTGYSKLGTIEEIYVTENNLSKLKTVEIYKNADGVLAWRALANTGDDLLVGIKNTLKSVGITDVNILSKLDNWQTSTLTKFDGIINNPNYTGILNEFKLNTDLFDKFKLVEETWWAKYSMAGLSKCSAFTVPTQFKKYIGDIEVTVSGTGKLKLKNISIDEASSQYLGKLFDDAITQNVKSSWISGDFSQFPTTIQNYLSNLKSQGYKLVEEPQLTVLGKNPKPDFLLVKEEIIGDIVNYDVKYLEIKYLEIKYLDDVPYTPSQKAITQNVPVLAKEKNTEAIRDINDIVIIPENTDFTISEVTN